MNPNRAIPISRAIGQLLALSLLGAGLAPEALAQGHRQFPAPKTVRPAIQPDARRLIERVELRMGSLRSFRAKFRRTGKNPDGISKVDTTLLSVAILKPSLYRIDSRTTADSSTTVCIADSSRVIYHAKDFAFQGTDPSCIDNVLPPNLTLASRTIRRLLWPGEWHHGRLDERGLISLAIAGTDTIGGRALRVLEWIYRDSYQAESDDELRITTMSVDSSGLIWRIQNEEPKLGYQRDYLMTDFSETDRLELTDFVIPGVTDTFPPLPKNPPPEKPGKIDLAKVDFSVPLAGGGTFSLSKALASRSLLAIYTWSYW